MPSDLAIPRRRRTAVAALVATALATSPAYARDIADPFNALSVVPPPIGLRPAPAGAALPCQPAEPGKPLGLEDVVDAALCNNPRTREVWANARAQAAQVGVAQAAYLPAVSASATASHNRSDTTRTGSASSFTQKNLGVDFAWLLFDFGTRAASLENARQLFAASAATRDATVQGVFLAAMQAFFQVQTAIAALDASRQSEKASLESLNAAEARYTVGVAAPADRLQARTAYAQAVLNRITAEGTLKIAQGTLANVIGEDPTRPLTLAPMQPATPAAGFEANVATLIEEARRRRPDLVAAEAQFQAARANIDAARAGGMPTLSLGLGAGRSYSSGSPAADSSSIGVTLNIPIFSGFATTYRVRTAEAQADAQAARRDQVRLQVAAEVWNAYAALTTATQSVKSAEDLLESATQSEKVAAGRYKAGAGNILDLLSAQAALAGARQQRIQSGYGWFAARAALAQAMGALEGETLAELAPAATQAPPFSLTPSPSPARGRGELRESLRDSHGMDRP